MALTAAALASLFGACAAAFGAWALVKQDVRLLDFRQEAAQHAHRGRRPDRDSRCAVTALCSSCLWAAFGRSLPQAGSVLLGIIAATAGAMWFAGRHRKKRRMEDIRGEWPVLLEGMAVAALSGLDLNGAFLAAARRTAGALREEVDKASVRLAGGLQLSKALDVLSKDGVPGADRLRSLLLRCEVLGTPVADVLQTLALEAATVERQDIEGRFNALPLRLSVITVVFLLPPVLVTSIAPHVLMFLNSRW